MLCDSCNQVIKPSEKIREVVVDVGGEQTLRKQYHDRWQNDCWEKDFVFILLSLQDAGF